MDVFPVNWDSVPEVMNKEQFFRICHISKSTALHLLKSGKVPCEWSGKKTRCYKIRKEDVKAYLEERAIFPELYSAPKGWYGTHYVARLSKELPEDTLRQMHGYYEKLLRKYPDVVTVKDVVTLTGYTLTTVHNWCSRGSLKAFQKGLKFCIPKIFLVDFFCSLTFRSITRKSLWHIVDDKTAFLIAEDSVDTGNGLHQVVALHRFISCCLCFVCSWAVLCAFFSSALSCKTSLMGCFLGGSLLSSVPGVAFRTQ